MATITKLRRVANPRRKRRSFRSMRNKKGRFVKKTAVRRKKRANPKRTHTAKRRVVRRRSNPVLIELVSALNPRKRRKTSVAKRKYRRSRKSNPTGAVKRRRTRRTYATAKRVVRRRRTRRNPVAVAPVRRRRRYTRRRSRMASNPRRRRSFSRRRNPVFGHSGGKDMLMMVGGGLVGVAATKFIPTLIPASLTASLGTSPLVSVVMTGAGAFAAGWLARRFVSQAFGDAVLFGGLMQTGSAALAAFAPASIASQLALSGVGDIVPGWYSVPQNSVTNRAPVAMMPAGKGVAGFAPGGFGFRRR